MARRARATFLAGEEAQSRQDVYGRGLSDDERRVPRRYPGDRAARNEASRQGMRDAAVLADGHNVPRFTGPHPYEYRRAFDLWRRALTPQNQPHLSHMGWGKVSGPG